MRPIIIRRAPEGGSRVGHHGGGWKVAYADFVTAMMAFFLLLWLVGSADKDTLKGLAEFFSDAKVNTGPPGGAGGVLEGFSFMPEPVLNLTPGAAQPSLVPLPAISSALTNSDTLEEGEVAPSVSAAGQQQEAAGAVALQDERAFDSTAADILGSLQERPELRAFKDSFRVERAPEGLRVEILEREQVAMFPVGSATMFPHTRRLLALVVEAVADVPNKLSIRGHADALRFPQGAAYDNWWLSSDRANATRRAMVAEGLDPARVAEVVGRGDAEPLEPGQPYSPRNRRISIILLPGGSSAPAPSP